MGAFFPPHKKVVFFDMNNTLIDRRKCFDSAFIETVNDLTSRWDTDAERSWSAHDALQSYKLEWSKQRNGSARESLSPLELRQICLRKALQPYPIAVSTNLTRSFFDHVEKIEDSYVSLFSGVKEALEELSDRYRLAIISNGNRQRLEHHLVKLGLDRWISTDRLFTSSGDTPRKPHPAIYESSMRAMRTNCTQSIMVGNSWKNDVVGSTRCGLDAIWIHAAHIKKVSQRKLGKQKVIIVRSVEQLIHIL